MSENNYPPHIVYTDENLGKLSFEQINDEFNNMLEYALGPSLCPKCGYVSWISGDRGSCLQQGRPETTNPIVIKYWKLYDKAIISTPGVKTMSVIQSLGMTARKADEEGMKILLKNPEVLRDNFYWECQTCHTRFISKVSWEIFGVDKK